MARVAAGSQGSYGQVVESLENEPFEKALTALCDEVTIAAKQGRATLMGVIRTQCCRLVDEQLQMFRDRAWERMRLAGERHQEELQVQLRFSKLQDHYHRKALQDLALKLKAEKQMAVSTVLAADAKASTGCSAHLLFLLWAAATQASRRDRLRVLSAETLHVETAAAELSTPCVSEELKAATKLSKKRQVASQENAAPANGAETNHQARSISPPVRERSLLRRPPPATQPQLSVEAGRTPPVPRGFGSGPSLPMRPLVQPPSRSVSPPWVRPAPSENSTTEKAQTSTPSVPTLSSRAVAMTSPQFGYPARCASPSGTSPPVPLPQPLSSTRAVGSPMPPSRGVVPVRSGQGASILSQSYSSATALPSPRTHMVASPSTAQVSWNPPSRLPSTPVPSQVSLGCSPVNRTGSFTMTRPGAVAGQLVSTQPLSSPYTRVIRIM